MNNDEATKSLIAEEEGCHEVNNNSKQPRVDSLRDFCFRSYVIIIAILVRTGYTLLVAYTRQMTPKADDAKLYSSTTVVFFSECVKFAITVFFVYYGCNFSLARGNQLINREFFKLSELAKMSVPSMAYAIQNNLDFVALSRLDASVYQVTTQLKIPSTAVFMMLFLGRRFSVRRWIALFLLCVGVASVQLDGLEGENPVHLVSPPRFHPAKNNYKIIITFFNEGVKPAVPGLEGENQVHGKPHAAAKEGSKALGILAVITICVIAGFAGVYFEKMLKDGSSTPFWIRNMQMYFCGVCSSLLGCLSDLVNIREYGFLHGYNPRVWLIVFFLSLGGIYISLIMKHLDNVYKSFANSISIVMVTLFSLMIFDDSFIGMFFIFGAATVCFSVVLYNTVE